MRGGLGEIGWRGMGRTGISSNGGSALPTGCGLMSRLESSITPQVVVSHAAHGLACVVIKEFTEECIGGTMLAERPKSL